MTAGRRLSAYSRAVTDLVHEARLLAEIPVAERDTDDYRARLAAFNTRKARLLAGAAELDEGR
jgi:hypothetical protein